MKNTFKILMLMLVTTGLVFSSCKKDDDKDNTPAVSENQKTANLLVGTWMVTKVDGQDPEEEDQADWLFNACTVSTTQRCSGSISSEDPDKGVISFPTTWTITDNGKKLDYIITIPLIGNDTTIVDIKSVNSTKLVLYNDEDKSEIEFTKK